MNEEIDQIMTELFVQPSYGMEKLETLIIKGKKLDIIQEIMTADDTTRNREIILKMYSILEDTNNED